MIASIKNVIWMYSQLLFCIAHNPFYWSCSVCNEDVGLFVCIVCLWACVELVCAVTKMMSVTWLCWHQPLFVCLSSSMCGTLAHSRPSWALQRSLPDYNHPRTHTLAKAAKTLSQNFSDGCQVCAADGEKKERSRKCAECFCVLAQ